SGDPGRFVYGIDLDGRLIGFLNEVHRDGETIELGYVIHPDWQRRGCMTEALKAAVDALFAMGWSAVRAGFFEGNDASRRVMEKAGMTRVDLTEVIEYRGESHNVVYYEIKNEIKAG
ncbi:MAG: GNAT family N-acetyltransferase, partial [Clostridia bacterium]|nr:GNAT family N-acetyltransferase [Clostridia bacterium]